MAAGLAREDPDEPLHVVRYRTVMGRVPARDMAVTATLRCADSPFSAGSGEPGSGKEVDLPQFPVDPSRKSERFLYQPEPNGMVQMQRNKGHPAPSGCRDGICSPGEDGEQGSYSIKNNMYILILR